MINTIKQKNNFANTEFHQRFLHARTTFNQRSAFKFQSDATETETLAEVRQVKQLLKNHLLTALPDSVLARLLAHLEPISLKSGETLYKPGENVKYVYFPENAVVSHLHIVTSGSTVETAMIGKHGFVGLGGVLSAQFSPAHWAEVVIGGSAFKVKTDIVRHEFKRSQALQALLLDFANQHFLQISQKAVCNIHHLAEERFCNWLLMLEERFSNDLLPLTHDQIARYLGVHRPSVTHIAKSLRERGLIDYVRGYIRLLDRSRLETSACECYSMISENVLAGVH